MKVVVGTKIFELDSKQKIFFESFINKIKDSGTPSTKRCIRVVAYEADKQTEYYITNKQADHFIRININSFKPIGFLQKAEYLDIKNAIDARAKEQSKADKAAALVAAKTTVKVAKKPATLVEPSAIDISLQIAGLRSRLPAIEKYINYKFHNKELLLQAFKTKAIANGTTYNSAPLEFIGDRVLYTLVTSEFAKEKLEIESGNAYICDMTQFSECVQKATTNDSFVKYVKDTALKDCLIQTLKTSEKVYANCFESIIGAVALDCNYNHKKLLKVYKALTSPKKVLRFKY